MVGNAPWGRWIPFWAVITLAAVLWALGAGVIAPLLLQADPAGVWASVLRGWTETLRDGVLILIGFGLLVPATVALGEKKVGEWVEPATPLALGAMRMWIATIVLASVLWEDLPSSAYLPRGMLEIDRHWLIGLLRSLPIGFDRFLTDPQALRMFEAGTIGLLLLALTGAFTRWSVPAAAIAYLLFGSILRSYAWTYHTGLVPLYGLLILSFTPCGDALSLDRWLKRRRGKQVPRLREKHLTYGLGRYLVWLAVALPYTFAGLSKLRNTGVTWWRGEHLKQLVLDAVLEPMHFDFQLTYALLIAPTWTFDLLGLTALLTELAFALVLVSAVARVLLPAMMAATHIGILLMQNILFPDLIAVQAIFYDWSGLIDRIPRLKNLSDRLDVGVPTFGTRGQARVAQTFLLVAFFAWATRTERFPLTAMQMFSRPVPIGASTYVRPYVVFEDGRSEPARFERWIGAVADSRYRALLRSWDSDPRRLPLLTQFLDAVVERANHGGREPRIVAFEFEARTWDFRSEPRDPERGRLDYLVRYIPSTRRLEGTAVVRRPPDPVAVVASTAVE